MRLTLRADGTADLDLVWRRYSTPEVQAGGQGDQGAENQGKRHGRKVRAGL